MNNHATSQPSFLTGGEMSSLIAGRDWSATPLGSMHYWPKNLVSALDLVLHSAFPMFLFWGPEQTSFYNDAFAPVLSKEGKHPEALGRPGKQVWAEKWPMLEPLISQTLEGQPSKLYEDFYSPINRNGQPEDAYWTFSCNPIKNDEGNIQGVLVIFYDSTQKVLEQKKAEAIRQQLYFALVACDLGTWELNPQTMAFRCNEKTKEIFGLAQVENVDLKTAVDVILDQDKPIVQQAINYAFTPASGGRYDVEYTVIHPLTSEHRVVKAKGKAYFDDAGKAIKLTGTIQDITTERLSDRRKTKLQQLVENSNDFMAMATLDGHLTYINAAGRSLIGLEPLQDLAGKQTKDFYTAEQFALIEQDVVPQLKRTSQWSGVVKIKHQQTGEEIPCHGNYILIKDPVTHQVISRGLTLRDLRPELQATKELKDSEKRFRNLVQEAPVATAIYTGGEMRIQWANDAMIRLWGKDKSVIGKTVREALPELEDQPFHGLLHKVYTTGAMYQATEDKAELVVDGELQTFFFNFSYKPLRDTDGNVYGILNMAIDVTEGVIIRRKLEESEKAFRKLIMQAPIGICLLKGDDYITELANEQYLLLVGRKSEELVGRSIWEALPEAKEQGFDLLMQQVKQSGKAYLGLEQQVDLLRNGVSELLYVNFVYEPLFDENEAVHSILVIAIDVTQQVKARQAIENAEERARLAVESANLGTYEYNMLTGEIIASERFNELFDMAPGHSHPNYVSKLHPDDLAIRQQAHKIAMENGKLQYECRICHNNGTHSWLQIFGQVYFDEQQKPYKIIGIARDITEQKIVEEELERRVKERTADLVKLNEELKQFTYVSSHDLKEPLRKIQVFGHLAQQQSGDSNPKLTMSLTKVIQAASRMSSLLTDLINYSTLSDVNQPMAMVDLNQVLQHAADDVELVIKEKEATIISGSLPELEGYAFQLTQLFVNLLQNALKFSKQDEPPVIRIDATLLAEEERAGMPSLLPVPYYKITVTDNGIGFKEEYAQKIFVVFQRLQDRGTYPGNGIGLSLCKKIVENHRGAIFATSELGRGSVFTVLLPQKQV